MIDESKSFITADPALRNPSEGPVLKDVPSLPPKPPPARVPELDGVRAIAIWWVLLFHFFPDSNPAVARMPGFVRQIVSHGWLGVDLFFVLSGFLITGILLDSKTKPAYFKSFYSRRALRILPVYLCTTLVMWICYRGFSRFFRLSLAFLSNFNNLLHVPYPLGGSVLWSLAVEEHFYMIWPLLIRFTTTKALVVIGIALVVIETTVRGIGLAHGIDTYELSWFRFDSLAFGALIAVFVHSRYCSPRNCIRLASALVLLAAVVTLAAAPFGGLRIGSPVSGTLRYAHAYVSFGAGILLLWAFRGHPLTAIFRSRFARVSADLSYCVYLIHIGILDAYYHTLGPWVRPWLRAELSAPGEGIVSAAAILGITFLLAFLSRIYLETPFLRLKERFT